MDGRVHFATSARRFSDLDKSSLQACIAGATQCLCVHWRAVLVTYAMRAMSCSMGQMSEASRQQPLCKATRRLCKSGATAVERVDRRKRSWLRLTLQPNQMNSGKQCMLACLLQMRRRCASARGWWRSRSRRLRATSGCGMHTAWTLFFPRCSRAYFMLACCRLRTHWLYTCVLYIRCTCTCCDIVHSVFSYRQLRTFCLNWFRRLRL